MKKELNSATCRLCNRNFGKGQMTRHLKSCLERHPIAAPLKKSQQRWFHLIVESRYAPEYWLHLQASASCAFGDVDGMLRALWLECCGHLSAFRFPVKRPSHLHNDPLDLYAFFEKAARSFQEAVSDEPSDDALMRESLGSKLIPGMVFNHEYDFGSTTELVLRVAGEHKAPALKGKLKLLARNDPPKFPCSFCGKPAAHLCQECNSNDENGALCEACARQHECGEDMLVPLVNSPRAGVCGYCGPSVEP